MRHKKIPPGRANARHLRYTGHHENRDTNYPLMTSAGKATPTGALRLFSYQDPEKSQEKDGHASDNAT